MSAVTGYQLLLPPALTYRRLGLAPIPLRTDRIPAVKWADYQRRKPGEQQLRAWFGDSDNGQMGVGIVLGKVSGNLIIRDFDSASAYTSWKRSHASLAKTLPTYRTARGTHVWARCACYKPDSQRTFIHHYGRGNGELRGDAHIAVCPPTIHPKSGLPYEWTVPLGDDIPHVELQDFGLTPPRNVTQEIGLSVLHSLDGLPEWVADAVCQTLPEGVGERHDQVFEFARRLKADESLKHKDPTDLVRYVRVWHTAALQFIGTKDFAATMADFVSGWPLIKYVGGSGSIQRALALARSTPLPPEAMQFKQPKKRLLIGLCRELQIQRGKLPFYLACRQTAEALGSLTQVTVHRWLKEFCDRGILRLERSGSQVRRLANEYRYLGAI